MNKRGDSNKACSWDFSLKKNKKNSMLIRDFRVPKIEERQAILYCKIALKECASQIHQFGHRGLKFCLITNDQNKPFKAEPTLKRFNVN